jgi:hypothetical protein
VQIESIDLPVIMGPAIDMLLPGTGPNSAVKPIKKKIIELFLIISQTFPISAIRNHNISGIPYQINYLFAVRSEVANIQRSFMAFEHPER